nr:MAG TPA: hypothetical protein [Caudoviricetes sp.]
MQWHFFKMCKSILKKTKSQANNPIFQKNNSFFEF